MTQMAQSWRRFAIAAPPLLWLALFFLVPFFVIGKISLSDAQFGQPPYTPVLERGADGAIAFVGDLETFLFLTSDSLYVAAFVESSLIAGVTTLICLLIGFPMAYFLARSRPSWRIPLLTLVMLPFWTSFLIRVYAWTALLRDNGIINGWLMSAGLITEPLSIINTDIAVYIGTVYTYLPFMVLPLFATLEKLDWQLLEAAKDLGASPTRAFLTVTLPLASPGIIVGGLLVFIPVTGEFVIPALLGSPDTLMIGKVLWEEFFNNRDWPVASALAIVLLLVLVLPLGLLQDYYRRRAEAAQR